MQPKALVCSKVDKSLSCVMPIIVSKRTLQPTLSVVKSNDLSPAFTVSEVQSQASSIWYLLDVVETLEPTFDRQGCPVLDHHN
eukprot:3142044-Amphidinium_carterae.1